MSIGRLSTNYAFMRSMANISDAYWRMDGLQEQMNTGKRVNRPSDDPVAMQKIFSLATSIAENEQYLENTNAAISKLGATSTILEKVEDVLIELTDITATSASSIVTSAERSAHAKQVDSILRELVDLANAQSQGGYIFGGVNSVSGSCSIAEPYTLQFDSAGNISGVAQNAAGINTLVLTTTMPNTTVSMNVSGAVAFQPNGAKATGDIFNVLVELKANLLNNDNAALEQSEKAVQSAIEQVIGANTIVGSQINRLEVNKSALSALNTNEVEAKSMVEDADYSKVYSEYTLAELLLNTTLKSTSTLLQTSLMNFI